MNIPGIRIGVISNTDSFIPFTYTLATQGVLAHVFFSPSADQFVNQKVAAFIQQTKIPYTEERNTSKDIYQWLQNGNYDVCFVLGYANLIKLDRLKQQSTQLFNIHFGPLPGFRGAVPVFWQLKYGMDTVGLAIHRLSEKFDDGPVVWAKSTPSLPYYNYQVVNDVLGQLCVEGVFYILNLLMQRMPLPTIGASMPMAYQKRPGLNDVMINWGQMDAPEICNLIKACNPWNKGALSIFKEQEVKLLDAIIVTEQFANNVPAGTIVADNGCLHIYCRDGRIINVNMLFFNNSFLPAYLAKNAGLLKGEKFS